MSNVTEIYLRSLSYATTLILSHGHTFIGRLWWGGTIVRLGMTVLTLNYNLDRRDYD
jgi:hypothetical protein